MARRPGRVNIGGVDEVEAGIDEAIEHRMRCRFIGGPAEHITAEAQGCDVETGTAEGAKHHGVTPLSISVSCNW